MPEGWENRENYNVSAFSELPHRHFGFNQHMLINAEFKEALRQVLWRFKAPIRYAFAYGSGVFPQTTKVPENPPPSPHPNPPEAVKRWQIGGGKNIDFIFGVTHTQHWHSLNLMEHPDHYSFLGKMGSGVVGSVQDKIGAGAYFHPYINVNGMMIKYGVVNLETLQRDLINWDTLYLAGRLQKPVKILRDDPTIRLAVQKNLISALRTALLMLPGQFTERELYFSIAGLSYIGDPRMSFRAERPSKVYDIVDSQMPNFRQLYYPLIQDLPNVRFNDPRTAHDNWMGDPNADCALEQDMDPVKRGNMVRRLPPRFQRRLYEHYQDVFAVPAKEVRDLVAGQADESSFSRRFGGAFDQRIGAHPQIKEGIKQVVSKTVTWPTVMQSFKGILSAGPIRSLKYLGEKRQKGKLATRADGEKADSVEQRRAVSSSPADASDASSGDAKQKQ